MKIRCLYMEKAHEGLKKRLCVWKAQHRPQGAWPGLEQAATAESRADRGSQQLRTGAWIGEMAQLLTCLPYKLGDLDPSLEPSLKTNKQITPFPKRHGVYNPSAGKAEIFLFLTHTHKHTNTHKHTLGLRT